MARYWWPREKLLSAFSVSGPLGAVTVGADGAVVSMTMSLLLPRDPTAPGDASVNVAGVVPSDAALIVPVSAEAEE